MTEDEVMDILAGHLENNSTEEALVLSQRDVGFQLIDELAGRELNEEFLHILRTVVETQSEFAFFRDLITATRDTAYFSRKRLARLLPMYRKFIGIFTFFYDHYDNINFGILAKNLSKEILKELIEVLNEKYQRYGSQFQKGGYICLDRGDLKAIKLGLDFTYHVLLGKEKTIIKFREEFNCASGALRRIQAQLIPPAEMDDG